MNDLQGEQTFVNNAFGTVTSNRVIYNRAKGWFSGGSRGDIPLKHVTAVQLETARSVLGAILLLLLCIGMLGGSEIGAAQFLGVLALLWAALLLWGSPSVVVNTAGQDLRSARGLPWQRSEATAFVEALRSQLFRE